MNRIPRFTLPLLALAMAAFAAAADEYAIRDNGRQFVISAPSGQELIAYQYAVMPAPEGVDPAFARSGFIHPVQTLAGRRLTQIQPADHYHHYGVWNPWTHTEFRGREVDFWNLAKKQGTVRYAGVIGLNAGPDGASLVVRHEHVVFNDDQTETIALVEEQTIAVGPAAAPDAYLLSIDSAYRCGGPDPITLLEYRYGGFGWRTTEVWNADNSSVLTSEGIPRVGSDGSLARWCIVQGAVGQGQAGAVVLSHPDNYNHPEPLRIWPADAKNGGQIFFNFSPTKNRDWKLEPDRTYRQRYGMVIFDGKMDPATAESAWQAYSKK